MTDRLAIDGGDPIREQPFPERNLFGSQELSAIAELFERHATIGYQGEPEEQYCDTFAAMLGGGYADGVNSGTAAIYVALRALDLEPFTEVIVSPITDPGGQMPVALMGCIPVVADAAEGSYNTGPEQIEECITPQTSAICVGHILGEPLDMHGIMEVAERHDLPVIEDAAQAHGATLNGKPVGTFGDIAAFSTMFGKHYATGGQGGVVFTQDEERYWAARRIADRGKPFGLGAERSNVVASLNFNLDDLAATIGSVQLKRLPSIIESRRTLVEQLSSAIGSLPGIRLPDLIPGANPSYWYWRLAVETTELTCEKESFCAALQAEGIPLTARYDARPHRYEWFTEQRVFGSSGYPWQSPEYAGDATPDVHTPNADRVLDSCFNLHLFESWGHEEVTDIQQAFEKVTAAYAR